MDCGSRPRARAMPNNYKVIARLRGCIIILVTSSQGNSSSVCLQSRPPIVVKLASSRSQNLIRFLHSSNCTTRQVAPSQTYGRCQRLSHVSLQLYRIFPHLGCNYYLSKLLFSPDSSEARILIGKEVHTAEEYHRYLANPSISGPWPNPLLKFDVFDGNPYKPALNSISQPSWGIPWRTPPAMSPVGNIALPSPCPINFNPRPLSYPMPPPPILFPSPPMSASSRPMPPVWHDTSAASSPLAPRQHYDPLYSQFYSKPQQKPFASQTQTPTPQGNTCCAITEARQDVHKALHEFKQDLERILENLDVRGGATNTPVKHNSCSKCGESFFRGQQFSCVNCPTVLVSFAAIFSPRSLTQAVVLFVQAFLVAHDLS